MSPLALFPTVPSSKSAPPQAGLSDALLITASTPQTAGTSLPLTFAPGWDYSLPTIVPIKCAHCETVFTRARSTLWRSTPGIPLYCSRACLRATTSVTLTCEGCGKEYQRVRCEVEKAKRKGLTRSFCARVCSDAATSREARERAAAALRDLPSALPERLITDEALRTPTGRRRYYSPETAALSDGVNRTRACVVCGKVRKGKAVMCRDCWMAARASTYLTLKCVQCDSQFMKMRAEHEKALRSGQTNAFCRAECHHQWMRENNRTGRCGHCDGPMKIDGAKRRYCSPECRTTVRDVRRAKKTKPCPQCGKVFEYSSARRQYCDRICADAAHSRRQIGAGNSKYKDGTSYAEWFKRMRPLIYERDDHRCRACGLQDQMVATKRKFGDGVQFKSILIVHHINEMPWDNRPENLILLCQPCHMTHHKSATTPYPWFGDYAESATRSMTYRWTETVTSLQMKFSSTTASLSMTL